ncbi:MAG TPA: hypothetical protein VHL79_02275 [Ramlibacter sp.]|nr:hypothetical protein [Ramlibacter sp.]
MDTSWTEAAASGRQYELRFAGLYNMGRGYAFPCDPQGNVDVAMLSERARANYLRARAAVGRDFFPPVMCACAAGGDLHA